MKWVHPEFERIRAEHEANANAALSLFRKIFDDEVERVRRAAGMVPEDELAPAASAQDQSDKPETKPAQQSHTQDRARELAAVLDTIEARARECEWPLVRSKWPGTKAELRKFIEWRNRGLYYRLPTDDKNLTDALRPHGVSFLPGRNKGKGLKFYKTIFPDYPAV